MPKKTVKKTFLRTSFDLKYMRDVFMVEWRLDLGVHSRYENACAHCNTRIDRNAPRDAFKLLQAGAGSAKDPFIIVLTCTKETCKGAVREAIEAAFNDTSRGAAVDLGHVKRILKKANLRFVLLPS